MKTLMQLIKNNEPYKNYCTDAIHDENDEPGAKLSKWWQLWQWNCENHEKHDNVAIIKRYNYAS